MIKDFQKTAIIAGERNISYSELLQRISFFGEYTKNEPGTKTVILSENREGWIYVLFSVWLNKGILVPVDATSTVNDIAYILKDSQAQCIWTSQEKREAALEAMMIAGVDIPVRIIDDYERQDLPASTPPAKIDYNLEDVGLIIYTSGTTGNPKGVMLSFGNMLANIDSVSSEVPIFSVDRRTLILLPLHHVLPLVGSVVAPIICGGGVAICPSMQAADIMDTLCRGKVGIFIGVPRLWQTLYRGIMKKIDASFVTRALFALCAKVKSRRLSRLVFASVRKKMGGCIDFCVSGGAALDKEIGEGLVTLGLDLLEGYGMSETSPIIAFTRPGDFIPGCVGKPMPSVQVVIKDGEVCCKGPNVMKGYYNRPEETAAMFDEDGWLHTGDLGRFDDEGRLYITGRKKEIIVLSNGKNINPTEIEFRLEHHDDIVKECGVIQDGDMLKAVIVPQPAWIAGRTDAEVEEAIKRELLEPYNQTVAPYKKLMSLCVFKGDLPRTKLDKLQRFKLADIVLSGKNKVESAQDEEQKFTGTPEFVAVCEYISKEKGCKVRPTDNLETDLAFDSLDKVGLQGFIEHSFGMQITSEQLSAMSNVLELSEFISNSKTRFSIEDIDWPSLIAENRKDLKLPATWIDDFLFVWAFKAWFKLYHRLTSHGKENIPADGPFILAPNHQSYIDGMLVMSYVQSHNVRRTYFFAKDAHVRNPLAKAMAARHNIIVMNSANMKESIQTMAEVLKRGRNIIIFPEGTRTVDGELGDFKKTFAILAKETGAKIVPVSIQGAYKSMPKHSLFARPCKISVNYLPAITPTENDDYESLAQRVKQAIADDQKMSK